MLSFVLVSYVGAFLTAALLTPLIRSLAPVLGLVDQPGHRKVHVQPTPMGGGIAVFLGIGLPVFVLLGRPDALGAYGERFEFIRTSLLNDQSVLTQIGGIAAGGIILFVTGLVDDLRNLSWMFRLGIQLCVAAGVAFCGVRATLFVSQPWIGFVVTVLWIMVLTNAMNFLDNMDGLSAGIGVIAAMMSVGILLLMVRSRIGALLLCCCCWEDH